MTPEQWIAQLPDDRKPAVQRLLKTLSTHLPEGFTETCGSGMIHYLVPHSLYPAGYHCAPDQPLPFLSLASQKNHIALYHMGLYADRELLDWFTTEHIDLLGKKPDMGKSCIRFKHPDRIPFDLIGRLAAKMTPQDWIRVYESVIRPK